MTVHLETPRLILRPISMEDDEGMFELDSNPEVLTYIGVPPQTDIAQSREIIRFIQQQYEKYGVGRLAITLKDTGEFIGWAGLKYITEPINNHVHHYDVGYRLIQRYWGKGYATEAAKASLDYGFQGLRLDKIYATAMPANIASLTILKKIGLRHVHDFVDKGMALCWLEADNPYK